MVQGVDQFMGKSFRFAFIVIFRMKILSLSIQKEDFYQWQIGVQIQMDHNFLLHFNQTLV